MDASPALFTVLAAVNAAGYDADSDSPSNHPLRDEVRRELAARKIPCLDELKRFVQDHRQRDATAELAQYISFGLVVDGPPAFAFRLKRNELPPDVTSLQGLQPLLVRFYREADIGSLWKKAQPAIDEVIARYHVPVTRAVAEVSAYLRTEATGLPGWRFQIYVDLLGAPNQIQTRSYGSEYFVVATPSAEPQVTDVRHAYLHFLLDPMATRYTDDVMKKKAVGDYALGAPYLDEMYKSDFLLLATESLIKAVEGRLQPGGAQAKQAVIDQALREGYVLAPHFAEQLVKYEAQDAGMRVYIPAMISAIDFRREERRLSNVEFSSVRPVRKAKEVPRPKPPEPTAVQKRIAEADQLYADKKYPQAKEIYLKLTEDSSEPSARALGFYGLARIAALEKNPELAEKLFLRVLESSPDPQTGAWSHVYLGRLSDLAGEREQAAEHYRAALAIEGATPGARDAAQNGLQQGFKKQ